ncbi:MAG: hypothetical protein QGG40_20585, partial [Myxococcota bacterium]|nr:hypothetical protein [Myxococcota bacterium]
METPKNIVKGMVGVAVALAVLGTIEILLRLTLGPTPPSVRVFSGLEPKDHYFVFEDGTVEASFQVSQLMEGWAAPGEDYGGAMDSASRFSRQTGQARVIVLGGSAVRMGSSLSMDQEFPALIGK